MVRTLRIAIASALLLAAGNAWALGLGQIEVKSRRNQPLLAEIPIISTTPGELEALQARLASPETFRRVGLSPPSGAATHPRSCWRQRRDCARLTPPWHATPISKPWWRR